MLTPYLPYPPASGGQIRTLNLLKYLSRNNEITLIALYKDPIEKLNAKQLEKYCKKIYLCKRAKKPWQIKNILKAIFSFLPFLIVRNYSSEAKNIIAELLSKNNYDVIHAETFYIMPHIPQTNIPILLVEQTIEFMVYQHFISTLPFLLKIFLNVDIIKLRFWEKLYWKKANIVATVSHYDEAIIKLLVPTLTPVVIPNGAGDDMFVEKLEPKSWKIPRLLFVGNFSWLQNTEAAEYLIAHVLPKLRKELTNVQLLIAGQRAKEKISADPTNGVEVIDLAQDDTVKVQQLYREATLFVAPIFGPGGTRLKILAAMASGLPVISTQVGVEGLSVNNGHHALIADSPKEFIRQILLALKNRKLYEEMRTLSYNLAKQKYSWEAIAHELEVVYSNIT